MSLEQVLQLGFEFPFFDLLLPILLQLHLVGDCLVTHSLLFRNELVVGVFEVLKITFPLDLVVCLLQGVFNLHLHVQLISYVWFLICYSCFFQNYQVICLFWTEVRLVILLLSKFEFLFSLFCCFNLHLYVFKIVLIVFLVQLLAMLCDEILFMFRHFKLFPFEFPYLFYFL